VDLLVWLGAPSTHLESEESSWAAVMRWGAIAIAWGLQSPSGIHPVFLRAGRCESALFFNCFFKTVNTC
jgi:hypothetical protein